MKANKSTQPHSGLSEDPQAETRADDPGLRRHAADAAVRYFLFPLAVLILVLTLAFGVPLMFQGEGGFFKGLERALGILLIAAGNLLSWIVALLAWWRCRKRWMGIVVAVQGVPAVLFAVWLAGLGVDGFLADRGAEQRARIHDAIDANDVLAFEQALKACGKRCRESLSHQRNLVWAARSRSHEVARKLLEMGATPYRPGLGGSEYHDAKISLRTCEGGYLPPLSALDLAVANQDVEMCMLLDARPGCTVRRRNPAGAECRDRLRVRNFDSAFH